MYSMAGSSRKSHLTAGLHAGSLDSVLGKALGIERALCGRGLHTRHDAVALLPGRQQVTVMEHQGVALNWQLSRLHCQLPAHQCRTCMSSSSQPDLMSSTELSASPEPLARMCISAVHAGQPQLVAKHPDGHLCIALPLAAVYGPPPLARTAHSEDHGGQASRQLLTPTWAPRWPPPPPQGSCCCAWERPTRRQCPMAAGYAAAGAPSCTPQSACASGRCCAHD